MRAGIPRLRARIARRAGHARAHYLPALRAPRYSLAACAIFRDEAPYLAEWVTFHRLQGVERFWLYDNLSTDDWREALAPELEAGLVSVTDWPEEPVGDWRDEPAKYSAYNHCLRRHRWDARWITFIDVDEFLFSPSGRLLPEVLERFEGRPAVVANWRVFGSDGHPTPPAGLVTESYRARLSEQHPINQHVKSIVQPRHTKFVATPHAFSHYGTPVGEDGEPYLGGFRDPPTAEVLRINHYFSKSEEEWQHKLTRPLSQNWGPRQQLGVQAERDGERDETILRFVPALKETLAHRTNGLM